MSNRCLSDIEHDRAVAWHRGKAREHELTLENKDIENDKIREARVAILLADDQKELTRLDIESNEKQGELHERNVISHEILAQAAKDQADLYSGIRKGVTA
jgi:hypothetical protein